MLPVQCRFVASLLHLAVTEVYEVGRKSGDGKSKLSLTEQQGSNRTEMRSVLRVSCQGLRHFLDVLSVQPTNR